jgi:uncharacterized membrane protein (DUF4010 family)
MRAIMQFVLLSLVILPVLPHQDFGPYGVWNPFQIWLMVVLIVGISLTGYIAYKCLGAILIAAMSNLLFKFGTVSLLGHRLLTLRIGAVFGLILICGAMVLWFWPA